MSVIQNHAVEWSGLELYLYPSCADGSPVDPSQRQRIVDKASGAATISRTGKSFICYSQFLCRRLSDTDYVGFQPTISFFGWRRRAEFKGRVTSANNQPATSAYLHVRSLNLSFQESHLVFLKSIYTYFKTVQGSKKAAVVGTAPAGGLADSGAGPPPSLKPPPRLVSQVSYV